MTHGGGVATHGSGGFRVVDVPVSGLGSSDTCRDAVLVWVTNLRSSHIGLTAPVGTGGEVVLTPVPPTSTPLDTPSPRGLRGTTRLSRRVIRVEERGFLESERGF